MNDPNMRNFYGRLGRIEDIHRKGGGFEADGTLGMAYFRPEVRRRRGGWLMPVVLVLAMIVLMKAVILAHLGAAAYDARAASLAQGSTSDRLGAYVLTADPLTLQVAALFGRFGF
ncbi:MAG: hypothetical protein ACKVPY_13465 [Paracoccaceae bacterium]